MQLGGDPRELTVELAEPIGPIFDVLMARLTNVASPPQEDSAEAGVVGSLSREAISGGPSRPPAREVSPDCGVDCELQVMVDVAGLGEAFATGVDRWFDEFAVSERAWEQGLIHEVVFEGEHRPGVISWCVDHGSVDPDDVPR